MAIAQKLSYRVKLGIIIILTLAALLPFVNKAFHIDDTTLIYCARQILKTPLLSYSDATTNWFGFPQSLWLFTDAPLLSYYVAFVIKIMGENELWLHIFYLIFPVIAIISMYLLSKRFNIPALLSTLLLVSTPCFMVCATNIMPDVALLAFYLTTVCAFIYGIDRENKWWLIISGFLAGLTCLIKYPGLTVIPVLFFYSIMKRKFLKGILSLSICLGIIGICCLHNIVFLGKTHFITLLYWHKYFKLTSLSILSNSLGTLSIIGGATIFPFLFILLIRIRKDLCIYFFIIWLALLIFIYFLKEYTLFRLTLVVLLASLGTLFYQKAINLLNDKGVNRIDIIFLLIWLGVISCYNIFVITWFASPKYTLFLIPPMICLFLKSLSQEINKKRFYTFIVYTGVILNFVLSVSITHADYIYADTYRNFVQTHVKYLKEKPEKIWFRGHWGFQYYMEKEGFTYLALNDMPEKGQIIIMPFICDHESFSQDLKEKLKLVRIINYKSWYPIRIMLPRDRVNFYTYEIGSLPYGISIEPLETFQIWQAE